MILQIWSTRKFTPGQVILRSTAAIFVIVSFATSLTRTKIKTTNKSTSTATNRIRITRIPSIWIPEQPDPIPTEKIVDAMRIKGPVLRNNCSATSQVRIIVHQIQGDETNETVKWTLETYDQDNMRKTVGGDEFYITFQQEGYHNLDTIMPEVDHPIAVARVIDLRDGTYELDFIESPMMAVQNAMVPSKNRGGNLTIHFAYTCGIGEMAPPSKLAWKNGGYTQTSYTVPILYDHAPPIRAFAPPERTVDLGQFDYITSVGDSTMQQFFSHKNKLFHPNTTKATRLRYPLNSKTWPDFLDEAKRAITVMRLKQQESRRDNSTLALVMGSSTWDILADDLGQGPTFDDHRLAMRKLIEELQGWQQKEQYNVTLVWKLPTAVHSHVVVIPDKYCHETSISTAFCKRTRQHVGRAFARLKYCSAGRSLHLYHYQNEICKEMNVHKIDAYEAFYLSADWHFPMDARHYRPELNHFVLNWFYSKAINISFDYTF